MKLLRHGTPGAERPGLAHTDGTIRDLTGHVPDIAGDVLSDQGLAALAKIDPASLPVVPSTTRLGPCVAGTGKFICIGLNYADHAAESGLKVPPEPVIFMKATSAICGPNDPILKLCRFWTAQEESLEEGPIDHLRHEPCFTTRARVK